MSTNLDGDPDTCGAPATDWALLIISILVVNVSWWFLFIPTIWQKGFKPYLNLVLWQCLRNHMPSMAATIALKLGGTDRSKWPSLYYYGPADPYADPETGLKPLDRWSSIKVLITDTASIVGTIMSVAEFCRVKEDGDVSGLNSTLFIFPTLPVALFGLLFIIGSHLNLRRRYTVILGILVLGVVLAALTLVMRFVPPTNRGLWYPSMFLYLYMTLPLSFLMHPLLDCAQVVLAVGARVGGVVAGAMSKKAYFPYCELKNDGFGGAYLALGLIGGLLAFCAKYKWDPFPWPKPGVGRPRVVSQHAGYRSIGQKLQVSTNFKYQEQLEETADSQSSSGRKVNRLTDNLGIHDIRTRRTRGWL